MFFSSADFVPGDQMLLLEFRQIRQGNDQVVMGKEFHSSYLSVFSTRCVLSSHRTIRSIVLPRSYRLFSLLPNLFEFHIQSSRLVGSLVPFISNSISKSIRACSASSQQVATHWFSPSQSLPSGTLPSQVLRVSRRRS